MKMTAIKTGFYAGRMVQPGQHFDYDDSLAPLVSPPKWAVPFGSPMPPPKTANYGQRPPVTMEDVCANAQRRAQAGVADTRPLDAQLAVHQKTGTRPSEPVQVRGFF